jgi:hypothetical protein
MGYSGDASGAARHSQISSDVLCKEFPEKFALLVLPKAGACDALPSSTGAPNSVSCQYGKLGPSYQFINLSQQYYPTHRSAEVPYARAQITAWGAIGSPGVTQPKGIGQYAISFFVPRGAGGRTYRAAWVNGPYVYELFVSSAKVTAKSGLQLMRLIASTMP